MLRKQVFMIFKHYRVTGGEILPDKNIDAGRRMFVKNFSLEEYTAELHNMVDEGLITDMDNGIRLTEKGEIAIYGTFNIDGSIEELSKMFQYFGTVPNGLLPIASLEAKKYDMFSPMTNKHIIKVIDECVLRGYIEKTSNGLIFKKRF
jgi:hypothetical protein